MIEHSGPTEIKLTDNAGDVLTIRLANTTVDFYASQGDNYTLIEVPRGADLCALRDFLAQLPEECYAVEVPEPALPGAVVRDSEGEIWVRIPVEDPEDEEAWVCRHSRAHWAGIKAVEVAFHGVALSAL